MDLTPPRLWRVSSNGYYRDKLCSKEVFLRLWEDQKLESAVFSIQLFSILLPIFDIERDVTSFLESNGAREQNKHILKINTGSLLSTDYRIIRRTFRIVQGVDTSISLFA